MTSHSNIEHKKKHTQSKIYQAMSTSSQIPLGRSHQISNVTYRIKRLVEPVVVVAVAAAAVAAVAVAVAGVVVVVVVYVSVQNSGSL